MKIIVWLFLAAGIFTSGSRATAKENKPAGWASVTPLAAEVRSSPSDHKRPIASLGRGALVEVYDSTARGAARWSRVRIVSLETFDPLMGWVESSALERAPLERFPPDADLLKQLGGAYLDDFVKTHVHLARFLVRQGGAVPALVCLIGSVMLPQARLQAFQRAQDRFVPGAFLEFPLAEMKAGIIALEVRDLLGDGNECLVTREPFNIEPEMRGVNLVIRRIQTDGFEKLWEAPLEYRNLASFPPKVLALEPREKNIGAAGTVSKGAVEFRPRGKFSEPVWRGKVEFHALGREEPLETVTIEKLCAWNGKQFQALR